MKREFMTFTIGVLLGYCLVQGFSFLNQQYLWTLFYR